jgi:hypothetical protein
MALLRRRARHDASKMHSGMVIIDRSCRGFTVKVRGLGGYISGLVAL